jgi:hypothetical protein
MAMRSADPDPGAPYSGAWPGKLIIRYTDGTLSEESFREAPHDYAAHLTMLTTVVSARIEVSGSGEPEWYEYREGVLAEQAP